MLLENYWIIKDEDKETFYRIRDSISSLRPFISDKLGYQTIITPQIIKHSFNVFRR